MLDGDWGLRIPERRPPLLSSSGVAGNRAHPLSAAGSRPWRMPRPMRRSWLRRNRLYALHRQKVMEGVFALDHYRPQPLPISLVVLPSGGLGYKNARLAGPFLPGLPCLLLSSLPLIGSPIASSAPAQCPDHAAALGAPSARFPSATGQIAGPAIVRSAAATSPG